MPTSPRPSSHARGYGRAHQALRAWWAPQVATGMVRCWRCREFIAADAAWDLGHDDQDRTLYRGPEHQGCNRATAGRDHTPSPAVEAPSLPQPATGARW